MPRKIYYVHLTQQEREQLETFIKQGKKVGKSYYSCPDLIVC